MMNNFSDEDDLDNLLQLYSQPAIREVLLDTERYQQVRILSSEAALQLLIYIQSYLAPTSSLLGQIIQSLASIMGRKPNFLEVYEHPHGKNMNDFWTAISFKKP